MTPEQLARILFEAISENNGSYAYIDDQYGLENAVIDGYDINLVWVAQQVLSAMNTSPESQNSP